MTFYSVSENIQTETDIETDGWILLLPTARGKHLMKRIITLSENFNVWANPVFRLNPPSTTVTVTREAQSSALNGTPIVVFFQRNQAA